MRTPILAALALLATLAAAGAPRAAGEPPKLAFPLACEIGRTCEVQNYVDRDPGPGAADFHCGHRTYQGHDGTDIRVLDMAAQRAGVDVLAAAAGRVIAIRDDVPDISIRAPGAPPVAGHECGNRVATALGDGWIVDYCHLARGSLKVKPGDTVAAGQPIARVGLSGNTEFPHLHISVRHANAVVDPFAPEPVAAPACAAQTPLWNAQAARQLGYKRGVLLNAGFAAAVIDGAAIEDRNAPAPNAGAPAIVAYARLIGLEAGDVVEMSLMGPDGKPLATAAEAPLDHDKAQWIAQVGRKRPPQGWAHGTYAGVVTVRRAGAVALTRHWDMTL